MRSLVLVAHGSRREASNEEVQDLGRRLGRHLSANGEVSFSEVSVGFLELTGPTLPEAVVAAVDGGAQQVLVLPYLLAAGRHVVKDIPAELDKARAERPDADIRLAPYLGSVNGLVSLLADVACSAIADDQNQT